ncbi:MAG: dihydrolipoyl dehydrogenase, partial [Acidimicrobiales bacterium]
MPENEQHFDVVVVGGGPAGYAASLYGGSAGLKIALVEKDKVGGTCLHRGCIPAKELLETAATHRHVSHAKEYGVLAEVTGLDWKASLGRKNKIVDMNWKGLQSTIKRRGVTTYPGTGTLGANRTVTVSGADGSTTELTGDAVILAAGSVPRTLPGFDVDGQFVVTSDEMLDIPELPETAVVIGGGAIGCEFASLMADLGTKVTILEFLPKILPGVDGDAVDAVAKSFKKRGIEIRTGVKVVGHEPTGNGTTMVQVEGGDPVETHLVVVSVGRRPLSESLGLDGGSGVEVDERGFVKVDELCRTNVEGVWAVGDLVATPALAHVGFAEAIVAIKDSLGESPVPVAYDRVPLCIYCSPEVAFAGHSEESAKDAGFDVVTYKSQYSHNARSMIVNQPEGLVKVIAEKGPDGKAGQVLGVHMVGPWATEQLGQGYLAVNWEATVDEVAHFIQPHPTMSEVFGEAFIA